MKKQYSKPEIVFENFAMSTNIAGDCDGFVKNPTKGTCAVIGSAGEQMFDSSADAGVCVFTPVDGDDWDKYCYHNPTEYNNLFNS